MLHLDEGESHATALRASTTICHQGHHQAWFVVMLCPALLLQQRLHVVALYDDLAAVSSNLVKPERVENYRPSSHERIAQPMETQISGTRHGCREVELTFPDLVLEAQRRQACLAIGGQTEARPRMRREECGAFEDLH